MSKKKQPARVPASTGTFIGGALIVIALAGVIVLANLVGQQDQPSTTTVDDERTNSGLLAPDERELRIASGTIVRMADQSFEMDATLDGQDRRLSVQLAEGAKVYRATIAADVSPIADERPITREEITVNDLHAGDAITVQSDRDLRGTDTVTASVVEHAVLTPSTSP